MTDSNNQACTKVEEVMIVRLDTDDAKAIEEFQKKWNELKVNIAFVPKHINFKVMHNINLISTIIIYYFYN